MRISHTKFWLSDAEIKERIEKKKLAMKKLMNKVLNYELEIANLESILKKRTDSH